MGRPEPCVLFTQTFVHPLLDEYVDEVIFAEPIVITACEFLEQNASSASSAVTLLGATSPPSFALEVFVQCDGEARFRRLCQPFLYSHSSSNVLEVEAVVTNHLVVRGSYRSLSLVVYGNTAEDLGQFNVEFDLDSSLANLVSSSEAKIEDLPPLLLARKLKFDESIFSLKSLPSVLPPVEISTESKQFLQLIFKILDLPNFGMISKEVIAPVTSTAAAFFTSDLASTGISLQQFSVGNLCDVEKPPRAFIEGKTKLVEICKRHMEMGHIHGDFLVECSFLESDTDVAVSKDLVDMLFQHFQFDKEILFVGHPHLSQGSNVLLWLSLALILCSGKESCFHFVNGGGMETLGFLLGREVDNSATTVLLMLLGTVEQATRFSVGCEGLLGWWPREDETVPSSISEGYSQLLKLVMQKQRHDVASLATYVLHRLRFYEVASRYEYTVLCILQGLSGAGKSEGSTLKMLANAKLQLRKLLKLMNFSGWVEDPSPLACAIQSLMVGSSDGVLSYKATNKLITSSSCRFLQQEIDVKLLYLLKERGFFPLSIALISSSELRTEVSHGLQTFVDVTSAIEAVVFSLMFCRTGLVFMLQHSDLSSTMINAFNEGDEMHKCIPPRYAFVLISKGFFCRLREVGINLEMHLRVVNAIDRLLTSTPGTEEFLSVLWELCGLSRSDCGRQALLALGHFSEALTLFIEALHSAKELEADSLTSGTPLNLAIYHAAAELCEIIVTDPTTSSVGAWIGHATDLHKALHSSSPGTNRKDAPTRLLEWIDGGVVYHKNGAIGLLRYAAILASGGDAHMTSTNILVCDSMDVENVVGDSSNESDLNVVDTLLGKLVSDKCFDGVALRDSSVAQLTTAIRILALISENADVAASLYDEGAMTVIYVILVNCRLMLERSSNNYDYLVDDAVECSSTSDLLLERNREKYMIDLLVPSLLLLMELLQRLKESKEQHRNTKLMNALLQLHRELSPKLAACSADLSSSYPESVLSLQVVCHLIASVLASWPAYAWAPGLFHTLLDSVQAASSPALGPKETCSMLCLLNDLFPDEGAWHWKNGMPLLTSARTLAVGTLLGPVIENKLNWYLNPPHSEVLLGQLSPHLDKISQVVLHYSSSALVVMQDMLRIFILRIARQRAESAKVLLRPILSWIRIRVVESSNLGETDSYKVAYKMLDFLSRVLEHPLAKPLLLKERAVPVLVKVLERIDAFKKSVSAGKSSVKSGFSILNSCLPVLRSLSFICNSQPTTHLSGIHNCHDESLSMEESALVLHVVFKFCQVLPIGKELLACLTTFKALASNTEAKRALLEAFPYTKSRNNHEDQPRRMHESHVYISHINDTESRPFPLLYCWINLYRSIEKEVPCGYSIEAVSMLAIGALRFCVDGKSFNKDRINSMKYLFGLSSDANQHHDTSEENLKYVEDMSTLLSSKITEYEYAATSHLKDVLHQAIESARSLSLLLLKPLDSHTINAVISEEVLSYTSDTSLTSKIHLMTDNSSERVQNECNVEELGDKFQWECPENLRNRLSQAGLLGKRKVSALEGANKQGKGENAPSDVRGSTPSTAPPMPTRRDTFRQRKPNTSRPPSMHVDDYVARERNVDGSGNPNVIAVPRVGSTAGRPPSIHVDEFMARQRERQSQNAVAMAGMEMTSSSQGKKMTPESENDTEVSNRSKQLKVDLDDDLQGIDIVFDAEENEPDDKLPFPNADDGLQHTAQSPQRSIVEETQSGVKELEPVVASNKDANTQSELSSRLSRSQSHTEMKLRSEPSVSSEKKYLEPPEDLKNTNAVAIAGGGFDSGGGKSLVYGRSSPSMPVPNFIPDNNSQRVDVRLSGPRAHHEPKYMGGQPPLPPTPPPPTISPVRSHASEANAAASSHFVNSQNDLPPHSHLGYHVQADYQSSYGNIPTSVAASNFMMDTRYSRTSHSSPGGSARPLPPLPPTPPPFSATPMTMPSRSPQSSLYSQSNGVGEVNQFVPPPMMTPNPSRPHSMPFPLHGNIPLQQSDLSGVAQNLHAPPQHSMSMQQLTHLQPLQPPQLPCPPQLSQQIRAPVQSSMQGEQGSPMLQSSRVQMQMQPQQVLQQQPQISPQQMYYQSQPQGSLPHPQQQAHTQHRLDSSGQLQIDPTISLQHYFSSPDAIQSLLSDRDKLCQLLEQHPKLMEMLQERLGQL